MRDGDRKAVEGGKTFRAVDPGGAGVVGAKDAPVRLSSETVGVLSVELHVV